MGDDPFLGKALLWFSHLLSLACAPEQERRLHPETLSLGVIECGFLPSVYEHGPVQLWCLCFEPAAGLSPRSRPAQGQAPAPLPTCFVQAWSWGFLWKTGTLPTAAAPRL